MLARRGLDRDFALVACSEIIALVHCGVVLVFSFGPLASIVAQKASLQNRVSVAFCSQQAATGSDVAAALLPKTTAHIEMQCVNPLA